MHIELKSTYCLHSPEFSEGPFFTNVGKEIKGKSAVSTYSMVQMVGKMMDWMSFCPIIHIQRKQKDMVFLGRDHPQAKKKICIFLMRISCTIWQSYWVKWCSLSWGWQTLTCPKGGKRFPLFLRHSFSIPRQFITYILVQFWFSVPNYPPKITRIFFHLSMMFRVRRKILIWLELFFSTLMRWRKPE